MVKEFFRKLFGSKKKEVYPRTLDVTSESFEQLALQRLKAAQTAGKVPVKGDKIRITWLPLNNAAPNENVYIGSEGVVETVRPDWSFDLKLDSGAWLIVTRRRGDAVARYKFEKLN